MFYSRRHEPNLQRNFAARALVLIDSLMGEPSAMAFGVLGLFIAVMVDPIWFADRMAGLSLVPEPLWWFLGAIVSFYFGARHQSKSLKIRAQDMQKQAETSRNPFKQRQ